MFSFARHLSALAITTICLAPLGCDEPDGHEAAAKPSAKPKPTATAAPKPAPKPTATAKKPSHPCPKGSEGDGTTGKPCEATGTERIMQMDWNRKEIGEKGPTFRLINKSDLEIRYGKIAVYFYDKAGKQLSVKIGNKERPYAGCGGNIFAGTVKPQEKIFMNFSCVKKKHVPEGTKTVEGEVTMVGFVEEGGTKSDTFWRNKDLAPEKRPKGGIKAAKKSKKK